MASTSSINNDYYLENYNKTRTINNNLDKDAFLKILITQLQNQDPTNPMDDRDFIAQMAQFSSLEQMQNVASAIEKLVESQTEIQLMTYTTFVGKEVKWHELTDEKDSKGNYIVKEGQGVIKELKFVDGSPVFVLADGKEISPANISAVIDPSVKSSSNSLAAASELIGKKVQYESNGNLIKSIIQSISMNNLSIEYILENGDRLTKNQFELVNE